MCVCMLALNRYYVTLAKVKFSRIWMECEINLFWIIPLIDEGKIESASEAKTRKVNTENIYLSHGSFLFVCHVEGKLWGTSKIQGKNTGIYTKNSSRNPSWKLKYHIHDQCFQRTHQTFGHLFHPNFALLLDFSCWWKSWYLDKDNIRYRISI